jgi:CubicO group peptidase (beta-lactamase class C family)
MVLVLACACCAFDAARAQSGAIPSAQVNYNPVKEAVSEIIKKEMQKDDVTGLSIALVDDQVVVWAQGFGYADTERGVPATPETAYRLGFLTNLFTATAAMQLVEQGKLDLDQPLQHYLPEFSILTRSNGTAAPPITLRHLLTHHSGLPLNIQKRS